MRFSDLTLFEDHKSKYHVAHLGGQGIPVYMKPFDSQFRSSKAFSNSPAEEDCGQVQGLVGWASLLPDRIHHDLLAVNSPAHFQHMS